MIRLTSTVEVRKDFPHVGLGDRILLLGSCFADEMGRKMMAAGFDVCVNPFGTLYNPASIAAAIRRLDSAEPFVAEDVVEMGAGAGLFCSFSHHTSFARKTPGEFLSVANQSLSEAVGFWKSCDRLIVTPGTAYVWERNGTAVANCLKRPASEFSRRRLTLEECTVLLKEIVSVRESIISVSPIRHLSDGAHSNSLSKATLLLAAEAAGAAYFPSYEILLDELRDYRFYAEDLAHPSKTAVDLIWEKFLDAAVSAKEREVIRCNEKLSRQSEHRPFHRDER